MNIREIVARRSDLSTFLVHLTRPSATADAKQNLQSILTAGRVDARSMFGMAKRTLEAAVRNEDSQKCVCFTETPLEYTHLLLSEIENRQIRFSPYGIAFPKKVGRARSVNPVWYIDITPGHDWLTNPVNSLIDKALSANDFSASEVARLAPFMEQMGTHNEPGHPSYLRKEFWWEREWRHIGNFSLPNRFILLCPEEEIEEFKPLVEGSENFIGGPCIDPRWGLEQIIGRLAGFSTQDTEIL